MQLAELKQKENGLGFALEADEEDGTQIHGVGGPLRDRQAETAQTAPKQIFRSSTSVVNHITEPGRKSSQGDFLPFAATVSYAISRSSSASVEVSCFSPEVSPTLAAFATEPSMNCSSSVEPSSASVEAVPLEMSCVISSK